MMFLKGWPVCGATRTLLCITVIALACVSGADDEEVELSYDQHSKYVNPGHKHSDRTTGPPCPRNTVPHSFNDGDAAAGVFFNLREATAPANAGEGYPLTAFATCGTNKLIGSGCVVVNDGNVVVNNGVDISYFTNDWQPPSQIGVTIPGVPIVQVQFCYGATSINATYAITLRPYIQCCVPANLQLGDYRPPTFPRHARKLE